MLAFMDPVTSSAASRVEIIDVPENDVNEIHINVSNNVLHVVGAANKEMLIFNVAGVCVQVIKVDGDNKHYDLNLPKGCYIVKVGAVARKIHIR